MRILSSAMCALLGCAVLVGCQPQPRYRSVPPYGEYKPTPVEMEEAASDRSPVVGRTAPEFSLSDQNGKAVQLDGLRGSWVVLYFYPKDDTPGCICQATEFTDLLFRFQGLDAKVLGVSEDSPEDHRRFIEKHTLGITLLSDPSHQTMTDYGAWVTTALGDEKYGRVIRTTYLIDPQGVIRWHWPEVIPSGHAMRVYEKLTELQRAEVGNRPGR